MARSRWEKIRARRRRKTLTIAHRRRALHLATIHGLAFTDGLRVVDCACELADFYFAKRDAHQCDCRKRRRGCPKISVGMCDLGRRDRIYRWRREARALSAASRAGRGDPSDGG